MYQADHPDETGSQRSAMRRVGPLALAAIVVALATLLLGTARVPSAAAAVDFAPTERQSRVARLVGSMFERSHYRQAPVNDPVSSLVLDRYLESLDGARSYFLASDIADFERYRYQLDDAVTDGKLEPGVHDLQPLPAAQPRAHEVRARGAQAGARLHARRELRVRPAQGAVGQGQRRARRAVAQARQERRDLADAGRQDLARGARRARRSATSAPRSAASRSPRTTCSSSS